MVRIAICDDEQEAVSRHEEVTKASLQDCGIGYEIAAYTKSSNLLYDITDDHFFYDLILLDIEMPGITGMELPEKIKPFLPNVKIIFITSHLEYAIDAFELSIFRYVPKNDPGNRLAAAVAEAARLIELEAGQEYITRTSHRMEKIPYKDIFYIERDGGKNSVIYIENTISTMHSRDTGSGREKGLSAAAVPVMGTAKVRKSLQQIYTELNAPEFLFIDRSFIVNIIQIMKISDGMAILKNGVQLPISRSHLQEVKQQVNRFWGAHI